MNTREIVAFVGENVKEIPYCAFEEWIKEYRLKEEDVIMKIPEEIKFNFPLKNEVLKLVYKYLYKKIPFSKEYVLKNYEKTVNGISYLFFPSKNPSKLVILFSGLSGHKTYNRYSWYWDESEEWSSDTAYLFFNDLNATWYVGTDENPIKEKYKAIIKNTIRDLGISNDNAFTVGGSMGGYASVLFSFELGLGGCLSIHPQLNYASTLRQRAGDWAKNIRSCGSQFIDAENLIHLVDKMPAIYLEYGNYEPDRACAESFVSELKRKSHLVIVNKNESDDHVTMSPSKKRIEEVINFFQGIKNDI